MDKTILLQKEIRFSSTIYFRKNEKENGVFIFLHRFFLKLESKLFLNL